MGVIGHLGPGPTPRQMKGSLADVCRSHTLRCDAKQGEQRFRDFDSWIASVSHWSLGDRLPGPIVKGSQPEYLDGADDSGVPVISTLAIQGLAIDQKACRRVVAPDYGLRAIRKPRVGDVLLTLDGGSSIGKPVLFDLEGEWAIDSHVAILRPVGIDPKLLVFLLASPLGQVQFQRAESGASGQTAVTEDDLRRFVFPEIEATKAATALAEVEAASVEAERLRREAEAKEDAGWTQFLAACAPGL